MASHGDRTGRDTLDAVLQRVTDLERDVKDLQGGRRVSMDRGDVTSLTVDKGAFEGQTMIQYATASTYVGELPYYFSNGEWRPFSAGFDPNPSSAQYQFDAGVVASLDVATVSWTFDLGDSALLDLTNPQAPVPVIEGVYAVMVELTSPDATWTPGNNLVVKLTAFGPLVNHHMEGSGTFDTTADPTHTRANAYVVAEMTATPGGSFGVDVENEDSVGHNLIGHISVQRIIAY